MMLQSNVSALLLLSIPLTIASQAVQPTTGALGTRTSPPTNVCLPSMSPYRPLAPTDLPSIHRRRTASVSYPRIHRITPQASPGNTGRLSRAIASPRPEAPAAAGRGLSVPNPSASAPRIRSIHRGFGWRRVRVCCVGVLVGVPMGRRLCRRSCRRLGHRLGWWVLMSLVGKSPGRSSMRSAEGVVLDLSLMFRLRLGVI